MKVRSEERKAREWIRSDVTLPAFLMGVPGVVAVIGALACLLGIARGDRLQALLALPIAIGLVWCTLGLWYAKEWARWTAAVLFGAGTVLQAAKLVRGDGFDAARLLEILFFLFWTVYFVLPSTRRRFARARGVRAARG